jgi:DNA-binding XRE family transcriptional regulator
VVEQASGNRYDVAADFVLYCCDPEYRHRVEAETPKRPGRRESVGRRVRTLRESRGWSQIGLARRAGVRRQDLVRLEKGRNKMSLPALEFLAEALGVPVADLLAR